MAFNAKRAQDKLGRLYDPDTGEYEDDGAVLVVSRRKAALPYERCFIMNQDEMLKTMAGANLGSEAYRVFFALCSKLDFENLIAVSQTELAQQINMTKQNFYRGVKRLVSEGVLEDGPTLSGRRTFRLNPRYGWKGKTSTLRAEQKRRGDHLKLVQ